MAHYVIFIDIFKVTWHKNVTSHVKTEHLSQKRNFIRNVLQSTRSFDHFRFKSYGPLSDFHKSDDLDLAFYPIFKKKSCCMVLGQKTSSAKKFQDDRTSGVICTSRKDRKTDKQTKTDKQMKATQRVGYFTKLLSFSDCIIDIDYNMSMSMVKNTRSIMVVKLPMKSVQWVEYTLTAVIKYYYNSGKYVTLTFDLWHMTLTKIGDFFLTLTFMLDLEVDLLLHCSLKTKK